MEIAKAKKKLEIIKMKTKDKDKDDDKKDDKKKKRVSTCLLLVAVCFEGTRDNLQHVVCESLWYKRV